MQNIIDSIRSFINPPKLLEPGNYRFQAPPDAPYPYRLHLRVESDGSGILIVNAATVLHLNQTATEYAYHMIHNDSTEATIKALVARYRVSEQEAAQDYQAFSERIHALIEMPDLDPVMYLDFERSTPYEAISAPYRLDCALTYLLPENENPDLAPLERVTRELDTQEWRAILDKAEKIGIPHIIFTGGEPTLREDLVELIEYAETKGLVTGIITNGQRLLDEDYFNKLLMSGLDHLMLIWHPETADSWEVLKTVLPADLFTAVHITITQDNASEISSYLEQLAALQPNAVSISEVDASLTPLLEEARQLAAELKLDLVWDLPVPYTALNPVGLETRMDTPVDGAGKAWIYVEPDGDVLPSQGILKPQGNLLTDTWDKIWPVRE